MAKGGGGSWKVAYADFVTAMMAFFLVMWIGAQDVKVRQSVANYFVDPAGVSKRAVTTGAVLDPPDSGPVTNESKVIGGRGSHAPGGDTPSPSTAAVINYIKAENKRFQHWKAEAQRCREAAAGQQALNQTQSPEEVACVRLATMLSTDFAGSIPKDTPDVYKDLLFGSFKEINWKQVATILLTE